jgi:hypothetical protein
MMRKWSTPPQNPNASSTELSCFETALGQISLNLTSNLARLTSETKNNIITYGKRMCYVKSDTVRPIRD